MKQLIFSFSFFNIFLQFKKQFYSFKQFYSLIGYWENKIELIFLLGWMEFFL